MDEEHRIPYHQVLLRRRHVHPKWRMGLISESSVFKSNGRSRNGIICGFGGYVTGR